MVKQRYDDSQSIARRFEKVYGVSSLPKVRFRSSKDKILEKPQINGWINARKVLKRMKKVK